MLEKAGKRFAIVLDPSDNVATLLSDAPKGEKVMLTGAEGTVLAREPVGFGHKIALGRISAGDKIVKYGQRIGRALADIAEGEWVHIHNMASALDAGFRERIEP